MLEVLSMLECIVLFVISVAMIKMYSEVMYMYKAVRGPKGYHLSLLDGQFSLSLISVNLVVMYILVRCNIVDIHFKVSIIYLFIISVILTRMILLHASILLDEEYKVTEQGWYTPTEFPIAAGIFGVGFAIFNHGLMVNMVNSNGDIPVIGIAFTTLTLSLISIKLLPKDRSQLGRLKTVFGFIGNSEVVYVLCVFLLPISIILWLILK